MKKWLKVFVIATVSATMLSGCGFEKELSLSSIKEIVNDDDKDDDYILESDEEVITEVDLSRLTETELRYAYAEVFARHGKVFEDENMVRYFNSKEWYVPNPSYKDSDLSTMEVDNANVIKNYLKAHFETTTQTTTQAPTQAAKAQIPQVAVQQPQVNYSGDSSYIIPDSSVRMLSRSELSGYSSSTLALIRNEIYARNGYCFKKQYYRNYFGSKSWYSPNPSFNESWLNSTEKYNIQLIKSME